MIRIGCFLALKENGKKSCWSKIGSASPLVKEGLDIDLFTHPTIKQRLVIARNVYGDDANIIMDTFYKKGVRQVVYLGTAGAIANYQVGDVVTPSEFIDNNNVSVPFQKNLAHAYRTELSKQVTVHDQTKHGRVPTIYHETLALLLNWKAKSIAAMDVEGFYLARFARSHHDLKMAALFVISDQTLGGSTIDESEARLDLIDESVYKLVSFLLPKVLARSNPEMSEGRGSGVEGKSLAQARYYRGSMLGGVAVAAGAGGRVRLRGPSLRTLRSLRLRRLLLELIGFQPRSQRIYFTTAKNT